MRTGELVAIITLGVNILGILWSAAKIVSTTSSLESRVSNLGEELKEMNTRLSHLEGAELVRRQLTGGVKI